MGVGAARAVKKAAVLGHPIGHSLSPVLHRAAYQSLGLSWTYDAIDVTEAELPGFLADLDDSWAGLSLTMPLKKAVLPWLDAVDPVAAKIQAVNTVVVSGDERLGFNTDVAGIVAALREVGFGEYPGEVAVLGAGATAMSTLAGIAEYRPRRVVVCARRAESVESVTQFATDLGLNAQAWPWERRGEVLESDVVVSTLPGDTAGSLGSAVPGDPGILLDVTYSPWPTSLATAWAQAGGSVAPGYRMLLWQAAVQVELMTGQQAPVTQMWEALQQALEGNNG